MATGTLNQAGEALPLVAGEPGVDGIGMAGFVQALNGDAVGRPAVSDLEEGGRPLAQIGTRVGIPHAREFGALVACQSQGTVAVKDRILLVNQENSTPIAPFPPALLPVT